MLYPVFLNLTGKQVLVVGGGEVAQRKVGTLLETGALTKVISPDLTAALRSLAGSGQITIAERRYQHGDVKGACLVISASNDPQVQKAVWKEAQELNVPVNTVDEPDLCTVIMPAVMRQGDLTLAISTSGKSPALARRLREQLAEIFGPEYGRLLSLLARIRPEIREQFSYSEARRSLHYRIIDSDVLTLLRNNDEAGAESRIQEIIDRWKREKVII
jgi:precorrin-2 dehydrogenase/sirohydrochlorin ferrochelatase